TCLWLAGQVVTPNDCDAVSTPSWPRGIVYAGLVALVGLLLLALLIWLEKQRHLLGWVAVAVLAVAIIAYFVGQTRPFSATIARLDAATAYSWNVIAEDSTGARVESETRRFAVK